MTARVCTAILNTCAAGKSEHRKHAPQPKGLLSCRCFGCEVNVEGQFGPDHIIDKSTNACNYYSSSHLCYSCWLFTIGAYCPVPRGPRWSNHCHEPRGNRLISAHAGTQRPQETQGKKRNKPKSKTPPDSNSALAHLISLFGLRLICYGASHPHHISIEFLLAGLRVGRSVVWYRVAYNTCV